MKIKAPTCGNKRLSLERLEGRYLLSGDGLCLPDGRLPGDYNLDRTVDQADYQVWKASFGSTLDLAADGNGDLVVNLADYTVWRDHLGTVAHCGPGSFSIVTPVGSATTSVPRIEWTSSEDAFSYEVTIAADSDFNQLVEAAVTTELSHDLSTTLSNGTYYVRVVASSDNGNHATATNSGLIFLVESPNLLRNAGFDLGMTGWAVDQGAARANFSTPPSNTMLPAVSSYHGSAFGQIHVRRANATDPTSLSTTFFADASQTYLLRWFAQSDVNRAGMNLQIASDGPTYEQASFNPSSNGWEGYHFAFKASGLTTITFTFEDTAVYGLDEVQIYDTNSGPDHTGTRMDPERHYLWRWGQVDGATGTLTNTDNNVSVPLPDGRVVWLYNDTYVGRHDPYDNSSFYSGFVRNFLVIQDGETLAPWTPGQTSFRPPSGNNFYWPNDAFVEGDKLKVVLHEVSGISFVASAIATLSLPDLTLENISPHTSWNINKVLDAGDGYLYAIGGTSGSGDHGVARMPKGQFNDFATWRFWSGTRWVESMTAWKPMSNLDGLWSISRIGPNNYVAISSGFVGSSWRASFASSPTGPWTRPEDNIIGRPPIDFEALTSFYYMPYLHEDTVQNGVYSVGFSDIGPSGADGDGPFLSNRPGEDKTHYNIQYFLTPNLLDLSPYTTHSFSDTFADNDPVEWKTYDGVWSATDGTLGVQTLASAEAKAVALGVNNDDVMVEMDVIASGGDAGVNFRGSNYHTGTDNFRGYYAAIKPGSGVILGRMYDGVRTPLAKSLVPIEDGAQYHLRAIAVEHTIQIYANDMAIPRITLSDTTFRSGTSGLRAFASTADWDNFSTSPGSGSMLSPATMVCAISAQHALIASPDWDRDGFPHVGTIKNSQSTADKRFDLDLEKGRLPDLFPNVQYI